MNYVALTGGLGNQMFIYAFKVSISKMNKAVLFHPYFNHSSQYGNAGYQLEKIFDIKKDDIWTRMVLLFLSIYYHLIRLFPANKRASLFRLIGIHEYRVPDNFVFYDGIIESYHERTLFRGTWQSEKYFYSVSDVIRQSFSFREDLLNKQTKQLFKDICQITNPVSIHIRRNDYLSAQYVSGFGGICTEEYYCHAVKMMNAHVKDPFYLVFSDDIKWCREHIQLSDAIYVDWNTGADSWQDMFMMSKCKHNIIANSSFSWWGAWLNSNPEKIVIAPRTWWNGLKDDVVPDSWIRI